MKKVSKKMSLKIHKFSQSQRIIILQKYHQLIYIQCIQLQINKKRKNYKAQIQKSENLQISIIYSHRIIRISLKIQKDFIQYQQKHHKSKRDKYMKAQQKIELQKCELLKQYLHYQSPEKLGLMKFSPSKIKGFDKQNKVNSFSKIYFKKKARQNGIVNSPFLTKGSQNPQKYIIAQLALEKQLLKRQKKLRDIKDYILLKQKSKKQDEKSLQKVFQQKKSKSSFPNKKISSQQLTFDHSTTLLNAQQKSNKKLSHHSLEKEDKPSKKISKIIERGKKKHQNFISIIKNQYNCEQLTTEELPHLKKDSHTYKINNKHENSSQILSNRSISPRSKTKSTIEQVKSSRPVHPITDQLQHLKQVEKDHLQRSQQIDRKIEEARHLKKYINQQKIKYTHQRQKNRMQINRNNKEDIHSVEKEKQRYLNFKFNSIRQHRDVSLPSISIRRNRIREYQISQPMTQGNESQWYDKIPLLINHEPNDKIKYF